MFLLNLITILLISIIFYTYLSNIVFFHVIWPLNTRHVTR